MVDVAEPKWRLDAWCRRRSCGVGAHGVWHPEAVKGARSRILRNARLKELWNFWNFGILEFWSSQPYGDAGTAPALWRIAPKLRLARHRCPNTAQLGGGSGKPCQIQGPPASETRMPAQGETMRRRDLLRICQLLQPMLHFGLQPLAAKFAAAHTITCILQSVLTSLPSHRPC